MEIKTIINHIQNTDSIQTIGETLKEATIFNYVQNKLIEDYNYHLIHYKHETEDVFECFDGDQNHVDLKDLKVAIQNVLLG